MPQTDNRPPPYNVVVPRARMNALDWIALVLMVIGGINWGLVGLFNIDLVAALFGPMSTLSRVVYAVVGLAALYGIVLAAKQAGSGRHGSSAAA